VANATRRLAVALHALLAAIGALCAVVACTTGPINTGKHQASPRGIAVQADGKIVVAGTSAIGDIYRFAVVRYLPDGAPDPAFGHAGVVTTWFKGTPNTTSVATGSWARSVAIQADGKVVIAGVASMGGGWTLNPFLYGLARYNGDGSLDPGFGQAGTVTTNLGWISSLAPLPSMAMQTDGRFVLAADASVDHAKKYAYALARYLDNGALDPAFGNNGEVIESGETAKISFPRAVAVLPDNKIVVAGFTIVDGRDAFVLVRYLPDGTMDHTFGDDGTAAASVAIGERSPDAAPETSTPGRSARGPFALAIAPDGKLVVAGASSAVNYRPNACDDPRLVSDYNEKCYWRPRPSSVGFAVMRFLSNGLPDPLFGVSGAVTTDFGDVSVAFAVAVQPDGKIVAAGTTGRGEFTSGRFAVARYLPDGKLDSSFGSKGRVVSDFGDRGIQAVALQPDGKLLAAGPVDVNHRLQFGLVRYLMDGTLDPSFGVNGLSTTVVEAPSK
jgi:uncharacterized delta-60 repeat protein